MVYHTLIIGLGAMGSAALYQLATRNVSVMGIDRYHPPHALGSSGGGSRITRLAIGEGGFYTPLALRSHAIWRELETRSGQELLHQIGGLIISGTGKRAEMHGVGFFRNTVSTARKFGIQHETLGPGQLKERFPQFRTDYNDTGYYEPEAGFLRPERCIEAFISEAEKAGASTSFNETVTGFRIKGNHIVTETDKGAYQSKKLIVTAGAWLPELIPHPYENMLRVYRQVMHWFAPSEGDTSYSPENCPVFIRELPSGNKPLYGFPDIDGEGVKICTEQFGVTVTPSEINRQTDVNEALDMYDELVVPWFNGVERSCLKSVTCMYTLREGFRFLIDRHPENANVIVASPCSGHGFKHSPAIGEILADLAMDKTPSFDISPFAMGAVRD